MPEYTVRQMLNDIDWEVSNDRKEFFANINRNDPNLTWLEELEAYHEYRETRVCVDCESKGEYTYNGTWYCEKHYLEHYHRL